MIRTAQLLRVPKCRAFSRSIKLGKYKDWKSLTKQDKQSFIHRYIDLYKEKHPCSKSNVMYRSLAEDMDEYDDTPYVFGVIYNELKSTALGKSQHNSDGKGLMNDPAFKNLLIK